MLPKDKSGTTSSKSITSKETIKDSAKNSTEPVESISIQFVKGVGPGLGVVFRNREIHTVKDLLFFFPRTYEDRSQMGSISDLQEGVKATLQVKVLGQRQISIQKLGRNLLEVRCTDDTGILSLKWFHSLRGMEKKFVPGASFSVTGKVKFYMGKPEMVHPEIIWGLALESGPEVEAQFDVGRIVPIYIEIEGVPTRTLRKVLWEALEKYGDRVTEDLPPYLLSRRELPLLAQAVEELHFPPERFAADLSILAQQRSPAHLRLIYGEFFKFEYLMLRKRLNLERVKAPVLELAGLLVPHVEMREDMALKILQLPFELTHGQIHALDDICKDFSSGYPMNRLVQGDVGSGKTAVAFLSAAYLMAGGGQVALMAPTEILAEQHLRNVPKLLGKKINTALLTGKSTSSERQNLQARLLSGEALFVIGTHALLEDSVVFSNLVYVIIDEQHRFGVEQRKILRDKGLKVLKNSDRVLPHSLILTATPIPRTLALTAFGDMQVTAIRDLPPGRSPIMTHVIREKSQRIHAYGQIKSQIKEGRQAYFIYPLINQSEAEGFTQLKSAVAEASRLAEEIFPEFSIGLLHGQMSSQEKEQIMGKFQSGEVQILVSTTVVEVGVDVPNATVMVIEHAERFGLSQLHQLRGRVGRGKFQSYCFLFSAHRENARLEVLAESNDGFKIAEADLEIRGPGEFLGTRQAGSLSFKIGDLVRDQEWLIQARDDAMEILAQDPELLRPEHECLKALLQEGMSMI